jgi:hypothetical protein
MPWFRLCLIFSPAVMAWVELATGGDPSPWAAAAVVIGALYRNDPRPPA